MRTANRGYGSNLGLRKLHRARSAYWGERLDAVRLIFATELDIVDGMVSDPEDPMDWATADLGPDIVEAVDAEDARADTLFLGAVTSKIIAACLPTAAKDPASVKRCRIRLHKEQYQEDRLLPVGACPGMEQPRVSTTGRGSGHREDERGFEQGQAHCCSSSIVQKFTEAGSHRRVPPVRSPNDSWVREPPVQGAKGGITCS